jgi:hypothetical protein
MYNAWPVFKKLCMNNMLLTHNRLWLLKNVPISSDNMAALRACEVRKIVAPLRA